MNSRNRSLYGEDDLLIPPKNEQPLASQLARGSAAFNRAREPKYKLHPPSPTTKQQSTPKPIYSRRSNQPKNSYGSGTSTGPHVHHKADSSSSGASSNWRFNQQSADSSKKDDKKTNPLDQQGLTEKRVNKTYPLVFTGVLKMVELETQPEVIARKFTEESTGLKQLLDTQSSNWELVELILVVIGNFCENKGVALFHNAFVKIVQILAEKLVFSNIESVILNIPKSRATNLGTIEVRLSRFVRSIGHVTTEMLTIMPALSCNYLGETFFEDICALKNLPSIQKFGVCREFDILQGGSDRMKNAWEQHSKMKRKQDSDGSRKQNTWHNREELMSLMKPPDDFRQLSVMPDWEDVCTDTEPFLRPNIIKGTYEDADMYLDVQFRLLREDFLSPLREGLLSFRDQIETRNKKKRVDNIRLYHEVKIKNDVAQANQYVLNFSVKEFQRMNWEGSKRLLYGSLLLLSSDNFNSFLLFTVTDRKPAELSRGIIKAKFESKDLLPGRAMETTFVMAESSVFFEAYRSVLIALQRISPAHFPMQKYILCHDVSPKEPYYLKAIGNPIYDLSLVPKAFTNEEKKESKDTPFKDHRESDFRQRILKSVPVRNPGSWPDADLLGLDPTQAEALQAALTRRLVVIQGPPGTGKTYLGLKIVQTLLHNKQYWVGIEKPKHTPILVICYTNHALDQFLEGIMMFTTSIVRIGGQSKCAALEPYSIREWKKRAALLRKRPPMYRHWLNEARAKLGQVKSALEKQVRLQKRIESGGVIHERSFSTSKVIPDLVYLKIISLNAQLSTTSAFIHWLGLKSIKILKEVFVRLKNLSTPTQPQEKPKLKIIERDENDEEEEWDKEDIMEVEGQRMVDLGEDEFLFSDVKKNKTEEAMPESDTCEDVQYALTTSDFDAEILTLRETVGTVSPEEDEWIRFRLEELQKIKELFENILTLLPLMEEKEYVQQVEKDFTKMPYLDRWRLYSYWKAEFIRKIGLNNKINNLNLQFRQQTDEMKDVETMESAEIIREASIIGITTTGAAKQRGLLEHVRSKIVVVEEAAEVLEAHIVTSLSSSCQHLILIGDHQQLRPPTSVYKLAKDYHLDVSLFERMINNGVKPCVLGLQHRMRPEVARLIVPAIYPHLKNHPSVLRYPDVPGMIENVFFLAHTEREKGDQSDKESRSHLNPYEADIALELARHLLLQGFTSSQITILTTYSGQLLHFRKLRRNHSILQGVRITVVDNFQGEENDVIILSLVRSNDEAKVGFLKTENRICVALSRAKRGFYLIGNMGNLESCSKLWRQISGTLSSNRQVGSHFGLQCEVHGTVIKANKISDFPPEGGCFLKCMTQMPCGHMCPRICHVEDRGHIDQKCQEPCLRTCSVGHACPKRCFQDCHPCLVKVPKVLPCKHTQITECYMDPAKKYCLEKVLKTFPVCKHVIELDCGKPVAEVTCKEQCGMLLDCEHNCDRICHKRSSHEKMDCMQQCRRTPCPEKHPCPKLCSEDCGKCMVDVVKMLPCGHERKIKCWVLPKDAYCNAQVEKILSNCQHTATFDCSKSIEGYTCTRQCGKLVCNDGHVCRKKCYEPCGQCNMQVERKLNCGHVMKTACYKELNSIKCKVPKEVELPTCGHKVLIACGDDPLTVPCPKPCDTRLECGHQCVNYCHVKSDPNHEKYVCMKPCSRRKLSCKEDHKCSKKCHEDCDLCTIKIQHKLSCGHSQFAKCHFTEEDIRCKEAVTKIIPDCKHSIRLECFMKPTRDMCLKPCENKLSCGHPCKKKCHERCSDYDCQEPVTLMETSPCGHWMMKPCSDYRGARTITEADTLAFLQVCPKPCRVPLSCEHLCAGSCGECFNGRLHKACQKKCGRTLVCGHSCGVNCAAFCPPCKENCQYRCQHSRCRKKCCEPCVNCIEPCGWKCEHYSCSRKCHDFCDRPRCDQPCRKLLPCNHPCVGLCGEVCPPLCRICHKEQLTEFILYGNEEEDDARFIFLEDCKHTIEVEGMDHWMEMKTEETREIQMKCCPRCKTIIRSCYRYGNVIKRNFKDIVEVKRVILRSRVSAKDFTEKILSKIKELQTTNEQLVTALKHNVSDVMRKGLEECRLSISPNIIQKKIQYKSLSDDSRYILEVQMDIFNRLLGLMKNAPALKSMVMKRPLLEDFLNRVQRLIETLLRRDNLAQKEYECFTKEVDRLDLLRAFYLLKSAPYVPVHVTSEITQLDAMLLKNVKPLQDGQVTIIKDMMQKIGNKLNTGLGISNEEREQVLQAMGLRQGHWFKCPNGHIYAIGDCGGAMQEAVCNECGARIGGGSHRLRSDNRLANEMDGARFAAWSEQANDMRNFAFFE